MKDKFGFIDTRSRTAISGGRYIEASVLARR